MGKRGPQTSFTKDGINVSVVISQEANSQIETLAKRWTRSKSYIIRKILEDRLYEMKREARERTLNKAKGMTLEMNSGGKTEKEDFGSGI